METRYLPAITLPDKLLHWQKEYELDCRLLSIKQKDHLTQREESSFFLREFLSQNLKVPKENLQLQKGSYGKPELKQEPNRESVYFNLSHSKHLIAMVISKKNQIGIDLEYINQNRDIEKLQRRIFHPIEEKEWAKCPSDKKALLFYKIWTLKESYVKAVGRGLSIGLDHLLYDHKKNTIVFSHPKKGFSKNYPTARCFQCYLSEKEQGFSLALSLL